MSFAVPFAVQGTEEVEEEVEVRVMRRGGLRFAIASLGLVLAMPLGAVAQSTGGQSVNPPGTPQVEQPDNGGVNWKGAGIGAATLLANVGYIPAKTVYAILGGIAGGAGFALTGGNQQTANSIWRSSLGGDYVLTPDMIRGDAPVHFSGPSYSVTPPAPAQQTYSSNPPPAMAASTSPVYPNSSTVYPNTAASSSPPSSTPSRVGAPPLSMPSGTSGYSSSTPHFTTSITGPGDSGTGPVREHDIE
jgi:hypothetical protein